MRKRIVGSLLMAVLLLLGSGTTAFAWSGSLMYATIQDVHLTDTYWWARGMGFNDTEAKTISKGSDSVDLGLKYFDKTWHLDRRQDTGDTIDTRLKHVNAEMALAKKYISQVPGSSVVKAQYLRRQADEHLGYGLHALQDYYAHMDAGVGKVIPWNKPFSHGMEGLVVSARNVDGTVSQREVEYLYDNVLSHIRHPWGYLQMF